MLHLARRMQRFHGRRFLLDPGYGPQLGEMGIHADMDWANFSAGELISDSPATRCYRVVLNNGDIFYYKRYVGSIRRAMRFWMRPGKAAVEVWAYRKLAALGIPSLDVIAFGERRFFGVMRASFLITRAVPNSQDLDRFALDKWYQMAEPMRRRVYQEISSSLLEQMRVAHKGGFFHHDLKWRNILVQKKGEHYSTVWIDAPRASTMPLRERRGAVVDFAGLARIAISLLSVYDRMRFIAKYMGNERKPGDAKRLYQEVAANLGRRPPKPLVLPSRQ